MEQVRSGGHDLLGFPPFAFEIKRCETVSKRSWWLQAVNSVTGTYTVPIVMFRQNGKKWKFLISAKHLYIKNGFIQLEEREFVMWVKEYLNRPNSSDFTEID